MPSAVCPMPVGHTPQSAYDAYKKKQKEMPGLTPAAWRKAAAQEMGLPYDQYLALWKAAKTAKKAVKMTPESIPTASATHTLSPGMGLKVKPAPKATGATGDAMDKLDAAIVAKVDYIKMGVNNGYVSIQEALTHLDELYVPGIKMPGAWSNALTDLTKMKMAAKQADAAADAAKKVAAYKKTQAAKVADSPNNPPLPPADPLIQTVYGPLTHDLAQSVYKKMKKDIPGATPAYLRHAAADYLGVDYNDYLKAWKKPTSAAQKAATTKPADLPPIQTPPLSPSSAGKYADKDITHNEVLDELAKAFGPGANKQYINTYLNADGSWSVVLPTSLLPTMQARMAVADALKKLGLKVESSDAYFKKIRFWSPKADETVKAKQKAAAEAQKAAEAAQAKAAAEAQKMLDNLDANGGVAVIDGKAVWHEDHARAWSDVWWNTLSRSQRQAVESYTGSGYRGMNSQLRGNNAGYGDMSDQIKELSSAMRPMNAEFTVFRGAHLPIHDFTEGAMWQDKGFMSTAIKSDSAWQGTKFEIIVPKGTKGAYVDPHSSASGEKEFIVDKGTSFRVIAVDRINHRVTMVAIPH